jgi:CheY-like chemotaxis protein
MSTGAALLHRLVEAMPTGALVFRLDEGGALILVAANAAATRLSGVDVGALLGRPFTGIFAVSTLPDVLVQAARTQTATRVSPLVGHDGRAFAADVVPLGDGAVGALLGEIVVHRATLDGPRAPSPEPAPPRVKTGSILVIDDEPLVGRLVERALSRQHRVTAVVTGREGLDKVLAGEVFDLILCDLMMPEMTGMDLYEHVLACSGAQAERMVFLTGGAFTRRAREFLQQHPYLEKPFDLSALEALVHARLGARG